MVARVPGAVVSAALPVLFPARLAASQSLFTLTARGGDSRRHGRAASLRPCSRLRQGSLPYRTAIPRDSRAYTMQQSRFRREQGGNLFDTETMVIGRGLGWSLIDAGSRCGWFWIL